MEYRARRRRSKGPEKLSKGSEPNPLFWQSLPSPLPVSLFFSLFLSLCSPQLRGELAAAEGARREAAAALSRAKAQAEEAASALRTERERAAALAARVTGLGHTCAALPLSPSLFMFVSGVFQSLWGHPFCLCFGLASLCSPCARCVVGCGLRRAASLEARLHSAQDGLRRREEALAEAQREAEQLCKSKDELDREREETLRKVPQEGGERAQMETKRERERNKSECCG